MSSESGLLDLRFAADAAGRTVIVAREHRFPLQLTTPLYLDPGDRGMAFVYVQNPTGGVFAGDELVIAIAAGAGTCVQLTTQSATKVYRMEFGEASQRIEVTLGDGAYFEYIPDALIPQAGSRFRQELSVELSAGASFVATELITPGRLARGERFAYERLDMRTVVGDANGELCVDALLLEPARLPPTRRGLLGPHNYLGTLVAVAPGRNSEELAARVDAALAARDDVLAAAAPLPHGAGTFARVLATHSIAAAGALNAAWSAARQLLLGRPSPRRRK